MISPMEFNATIQELELMFGLIEPEPDRRDDKISVYYDRLRHTSETVLKKAVRYLVDIHPYKRFPLVQEIKNAIAQVARNQSEPSPEDLESRSLITCEACHGTGHVIRDVVEEGGYKHAVATPCQCHEGQRVEARWKALREKQKTRR